MRRSSWIVVGVLGLAFAGVGMKPPAARAEAPEASGTSYRVQVVKVLVRPAEGIERVPDWGEDAFGPLITMEADARLALLRQRGATQVLMDAVVTSLVGEPARIRVNRARSLEVFDRKDLHNEFWKASTINEGVSVQLIDRGEHALQYEVEVNGLLARQDPDAMPLQESLRTNGSALVAPGRTLVLDHRAQVADAGDEPVGVELYAFVTPGPLGR